MADCITAAWSRVVITVRSRAAGASRTRGSWRWVWWTGAAARWSTITTSWLIIWALWLALALITMLSFRVTLMSPLTLLSLSSIFLIKMITMLLLKRFITQISIIVFFINDICWLSLRWTLISQSSCAATGFNYWEILQKLPLLVLDLLYWIHLASLKCIRTAILICVRISRSKLFCKVAYVANSSRFWQLGEFIVTKSSKSSFDWLDDLG